MVESLRALLANAIDYAGLFPPARLPLEEAAARYAKYRSCPESWMLARFVCPANRLSDLDVSGESRWRLAVVGQDDDHPEFPDDKGVNIELFELRLPDPIADHAAATEIESFVTTTAARLARDAPDLSAVMFEPVSADEPRILAITAALASATEKSLKDYVLVAHIRLPNHVRRSKPHRVGLKLRMGGPTAESFPSSEQVASWIAFCRDRLIPWKATAGLHEPLRHVDSATGAYAHGFINLFAATVMAHVHSLSPAQIKSILDDEDAASFVFDDDGLTWQDWRASTKQIWQVREESLLSFGSCTFDEPREGLRQLGWL